MPKEKRKGKQTTLACSYKVKDLLLDLMEKMGVTETWRWDDLLADLEKTKRESLLMRKPGEMGRELTPEEKNLLRQQLQKEYEESLPIKERKEYYIRTAQEINRKFKELK